MKPCFVKRKATCHICWEIMEKGEKAVQDTYRTKQGYWVRVHFHWECYQKRIDYWFSHHSPEPEKRRKRLLDPKRVRRLQSLCCYHLKRGHVQRVLELDAEIAKLRTDKED